MTSSVCVSSGFPFETTVAISRLILAGMLDRYPGLKLLLAHAGGTLPFLAGRLDSCVSTDLGEYHFSICDLPRRPASSLLPLRWAARFHPGIGF